MRALIIAATLALATPALAGTQEEDLNVVRGELKDPYTATFHDVYRSKASNDNDVTCGVVRATNTYGAFTVEKFLVVEGRVVYLNHWISVLGPKSGPKAYKSAGCDRS